MLNVHCYYYGTQGWQRHARYFVAALLRHEAIALLPWDSPSAHEAASAQDARLLDNALGPIDQNIAIGIGPLERMDRLIGAKKVAFTVWETTRIPPDKLACIETADEIWIPSAWGKDLLIRHGVPAGKVQIIPEGVDVDLFQPAAQPQEAAADRPFRFLCVGKWEVRKGIRDLILTYCAAFHPAEAVELVLHCHNPYRPGWDIAPIVRSLPLPPHAPIRVSRPVSERALVELYNACDAFVLPTHAECWGLPIGEAMACGLPAIVTGYSGQLEFANADNAYLIRVEAMIDVVDPDFFDPAVDYGRWAQPDLRHLAQLMRHVFEHREEAREKGRAARAAMCRRWTWADAAQKAVQRLNCLRAL